MQQNLFSENNAARSEKSSLPVQVNKGKALILKEQQSFNRLTGRIKSLQEKIKKDTDFLTELNTHYHKKVTPEVIKLGQEKIKLSHLIHEKRKAEKLSVQQNGKLDELILQLLNDAFSVIEPDEKTSELFGLYNGSSYEEEVDAQNNDMVEFFSSMFFEQTGIKIDPEELKKGHPDFEKLDENIKEQINNGPQKTQQKTKKQLAKEALEKQKEEIKNKTLRTIYLSLAKILHPDREPDENLRAEKEEYMKMVTAAYDKKNLMELLRLEILWVNQHEKSLENTPVETMKIFIQLLKDQVKDLESESRMIVENPAYSSVAAYLSLNRSMAFARIDFSRKGYIAAHTAFANAKISLEKNNRNRSVIVKCIEDFYVDEDDDDFLDLLPGEFGGFGWDGNKRR